MANTSVDNAKHCSKCIFFRQLANQGIWWCKLQHEILDANKCKDYEEVEQGKLYCSSDSLNISHDNCNTLRL